MKAYRKAINFHLFVTIFQSLCITTISIGNKNDHNALFAIKSELVSHPEWVLSSWNHTLDHCAWEGVVCGREHNRVVALNLSSKGLAGTISPYIGNLSFLESICLHNNSLYGQIPQELDHLSRLKELKLYNNTLGGEIPSNLSSCTNLFFIDVYNNKLEGKVPRELAKLSKLKVFSVGTNHFHGPLFDIISNLTSLKWVYASDNSFSGTIPESIGMMPYLTILAITDNDFDGVFPNSIFNISALQVLDLIDNQLEGVLPPNIGLTAPQLLDLGLGGNSFTGPIPITITNLSNLLIFDLSENNFIGRMQHDFGKLKNINHLSLYHNFALSGDVDLIISSMVNCSHLQVINLVGVNLEGILPKSISNLSTTLTSLKLGKSSIKGTIPINIANLFNLEYIYMLNTEINGSIPQDIGKLNYLQTLVLSSNQLTGRIPNTFSNLSRLSIIDLQDNKLEGSIPPSFGSCQNLLYFDISSNKLTGTIPSELLQGPAKFVVMIISRNQLDWSLHLDFSKQINLEQFMASDNELRGEIPYSVGECSGLQLLYIDGNSLQGYIPQSLSSLTSLQEFDLSRNNLSGSVPSYLSKISSMYYLNLSFNNFEGRVPIDGVFGNKTACSLVGNSKLCGGIQGLHLPKCTQETVRRKRMSQFVLVKVIILTICAIVGVLIALAIGLVIRYLRNKSKPISSVSVMKDTFMKVSYEMLLKATSGFSPENLLGAGSYGSVFKGNLDGKPVAVKVLDLQHRGASKSFKAECNALKNIRHRNLVGIITACSSIDFQRNEFKALVFELMSNGNLDGWLYGVGKSMNLFQRVDIAIDVAHALNYLHHECETPIVHGDLKPCNVLLDQDMMAHIGDFGLSKFLGVPRQQNQSISSIGINGTVGYAAPEYGLGSEASTEGDIYSYGILLLELITRKRPTDNMFKEDFNLHMYAEEALPDQAMQLVDTTLEVDAITEEVDDRRMVYRRREIDTMIIQRRTECVASIVQVGVACSHHLPQDRMKIFDAIRILRVARDNLHNATQMRPTRDEAR